MANHDRALARLAARLGYPHGLAGRLRDDALARFAAQLGHPHGPPGRLVGRLLNRANRAATLEAVDALDLPTAPSTCWSPSRSERAWLES